MTRLLRGWSQGNIASMPTPAGAVWLMPCGSVSTPALKLAAEILASFDGAADPDAEAACAGEIERRDAAIESGTTRL